MDEKSMEYSKLIRHPGLIFVSVAIPQIILLGLYFQTYHVIQPLISDETRTLWRGFGIALSSLTAGYTVYGIGLFAKGKPVHHLISPAIFLTFLPLLYVFGMYFGDLFPDRTPSWMASEDVIMYPGAFLTPAFLYALITAVRWLTPDMTKTGTGRNFVLAMLVPAFWYVFFHIVPPLFRHSNSAPLRHILVVVFIASTVIFLFFVMRGVFILLNKRAGWIQNHERAVRLALTLVFPLLGLAIYGGLFPAWRNPPRIFGDFTHPLFYALAALNGAALSLPNPGNAAARAGLYFLRVFTLPFTLYFFLVFLPFFPLSVVFVVVAGVGALMLTPLIVMGLHAKALILDYRVMARRLPKWRLIAVSLIVFSILPAGVAMTFQRHRVLLHQALETVYEPEYETVMSVDFDLEGLREVFDALVVSKSRLRFRGKRLPFITPFYRWLVFDNLTLSNRKIRFMKSIFFDEPGEQTTTEDSGSRASMVEISHVSTSSEYDETNEFHRSRIDLELANQGEGFQEYVTSLEIPPGAWVGGYYLWVGEEKVQGELVERKSALWIYQRIRRTGKDPGLVYYQGGNRIVLRVFPFEKGQIRKTGLEIIHKDPVSLLIDGHSLALGATIPSRGGEAPLLAKNHGAVYLPAGLKARLPKVRRTPYSHFILDCSLGAGEAMKTYATRIQDFLSRSPFHMENTKITLMNFTSKTLTWNDAWQDAIKKFPVRGGFYLDHALKSILVETYTKGGNGYPVIIVVTPDFDKAVFSADLSDLSFTFPESDRFHTLDPGGGLIPHSFTGAPVSFPGAVDGIGSPRFPVHDVRAWPGPGNPLVFVRDDGRASVALLPDKYKGAFHTVVGDGAWTAGLFQRGLWMERLIHPEKTDEIRPRLVRLSRKSGVLNPFTAYTVLENQAQWRVLKKKEKAALAGKKAFDLSEDAHEMPEPSMWLMVMIILAEGARRRYSGYCKNIFSISA